MTTQPESTPTESTTPATVAPHILTYRTPALTRYELIKLILLGAFVSFFIAGGILALIDLSTITQPFDFVNSYLPAFKAAINAQYGL